MLLFDKGASMAACMKAAGVALVAVQIGGVCTPVVKPVSRPMQKPVVQSQVRPQVVQAARPLQHHPAAKVIAELKTIRPIDCETHPCLALTFDDGPGPHTSMLLDTLAAHEAKATFFMLGSQAIRHPDLVRRVVREGHEVGNHSWGHANFGSLDHGQIATDIAHAQQAFQELGVHPRLMRPPYGVRTPVVAQATDMPLAYWNIDPKDWDAKDSHALAQTIIATAKPGGIVVLHDIKPVTVAAAHEFVAILKQRYQLVTVSQLMGPSAHTPRAQLFGRLTPH